MNFPTQYIFKILTIKLEIKIFCVFSDIFLYDIKNSLLFLAIIIVEANEQNLYLCHMN